MKRLWFGVLTLFVLACALFPSTALAYDHRDFDSPPGGWLAYNTVQHTREPINVVISARSGAYYKHYLKNVLDLLNYTDCFGGQVETANVDTGSRNQIFEYRDGGCIETFSGGNHLRGWQQRGRDGAWFLAVSEEHGPPWDHHIDGNGYNKGRDDFANKVRAILGGVATIETVPACQLYCGNGSGNGNTDHVPYDGKVVVITFH